MLMLALPRLHASILQGSGLHTSHYVVYAVFTCSIFQGYVEQYDNLIAELYVLRLLADFKVVLRRQQDEKRTEYRKIGVLACVRETQICGATFERGMKKFFDALKK